jgi:DNA-binding transcriptional regulator/RsmH inhibitor MraZ
MGKQSKSPPAAPASACRPLIPNFYTGKFERVVDQSGRVLLPTEFRIVGETSFLLVAWPLIGKPEFLLALPPASAQKLYTTVLDFPISDGGNLRLSRSLGSACYPSCVDNYGRLPIPEAAAREAGIEDRLILIGGFTRFELWNPDRFAAVVSQPDYTAEVRKKLDAHVI